MVCALGRLFIPVPEKQINKVAEDLLNYFEKNRPDLADRIDGADTLSDEIKKEILDTAEDFFEKRKL